MRDVISDTCLLLHAVQIYKEKNARLIEFRLSLAPAQFPSRFNLEINFN